MTVVAAKWTIEEYHRMVTAGILCDLAEGEALRDRAIELLRGKEKSDRCFWNILEKNDRLKLFSW